MQTSYLYYQLVCADTLYHRHPHGNFDCSRGMLLKWGMGKWKLEAKWRIVNGVTDGARVQVGFVALFFHFSCSFPTFYSPLPIPHFPLPILVTSVEQLWIATLTRPLSYQLNQRRTKITNHLCYFIVYLFIQQERKAILQYKQGLSNCLNLTSIPVISIQS